MQRHSQGVRARDGSSRRSRRETWSSAAPISCDVQRPRGDAIVFRSGGDHSRPAVLRPRAARERGRGDRVRIVAYVGERRAAIDELLSRVGERFTERGKNFDDGGTESFVRRGVLDERAPGRFRGGPNFRAIRSASVRLRDSVGRAAKRGSTGWRVCYRSRQEDRER